VYVAYDQSLSARQKKAKVAPMRKTIAEEDIPFYFSRFEKKLEENEYLTGPKVTIADVQFLTTVRWMSSGILDGIPATCLDPFPKIKAFKEKMEAIPEVAAYLESTKKK
jgi:glutathione S-transferase